MPPSYYAPAPQSKLRSMSAVLGRSSLTPLARSQNVRQGLQEYYAPEAAGAEWIPAPPPEMVGHPEMEHVHTFNLRQTSRNVQTLVPTQKSSNLPGYTASSTEEPEYMPLPTYNVKSNASAGFMNRKPDMNITRIDEGKERRVADARFDRLSARTNISYPDLAVTQELELESGMTQKYTLSVNDSICHWQPGPSKRIFELMTDDELLLASFTYAQEPNYTGHAPPTKQGEVGILHVSEKLEKLVGGQIALEQVLCSAVVMVERRKRRAANMGSVGGFGSSPGTTLAYTST